MAYRHSIREILGEEVTHSSQVSSSPQNVNFPSLQVSQLAASTSSSNTSKTLSALPPSSKSDFDFVEKGAGTSSAQPHQLASSPAAAAAAADCTTCTTCRKTFGNSRQLKAHLDYVHSERKLLCTACPKRFKRNQDLQRHLQTHADERQFICWQCERAYKHLSSLNRHKRSHHTGK